MDKSQLLHFWCLPYTAVLLKRKSSFMLAATATNLNTTR